MLYTRIRFVILPEAILVFAPVLQCLELILKFQLVVILMLYPAVEIRGTMIYLYPLISEFMTL